jgi:hypothetical protein
MSLLILDSWLGLMNVNTFSLNYFHLQDPSTVHKQTELPLHEPAVTIKDYSNIMEIFRSLAEMASDHKRL